MTNDDLQKVRDALMGSEPIWGTGKDYDAAVAILDAALAAEPQPVGMVTVYPKGGAASCLVEMSDTLPPEGLYSLYAAPVPAPQREWQGLKIGMNIGKALREGINEDTAKDALRYRWLEQNVYQGVSRLTQVLWCIRGLFGKDGESFSEAIDAAMKANNHG